MLCTICVFNRLIQGASTASGDGNNNPDPLVDFKFTKSDTNDSYGW